MEGVKLIEKVIHIFLARQRKIKNINCVVSQQAVHIKMKL